MIHLLDSIRSAPGQKAFEWKARREAQGTAQPWQPPQFFTCPKCQRRATRAVWAEHLYVCPNCGQYQPIGGYYRLSMVLDHGSFRELNGRIPGHDPLHFPGYSEKLAMQKKKTGLDEAVVSAVGRIEGQPAVVVVMDSRFFMGRMGEGVFSLMQMAKTSAAIAAFAEKGGLFISYLTHPTTGGVTASFASLGDVTLAEPGALIGFAGPRVIEQTIGQKLPAGFQRSEYLEEHGFVDQIVPRSEMKATLAQLLRLHQNHTKGGKRL